MFPPALKSAEIRLRGSCEQQRRQGYIRKMIFDTHAHYDDEAFDADREALIASLPGHNICAAVQVCASVESLERTPSMVRRWPHLYGAVGVHPDYAGQVTPEVLERIRELCRGEKIVAVGEIGLDYYWHKEESEHTVQQQVFRQQLSLAREAGLPFMVHSRDAAADTLRIVKEFMAGGMPGGIIHCFSYSWEIAREYLNMGLVLGIGGVVTYKNARKLTEVVEKAPLSALVLETDCPYLSPVPHRGKRNSSLNLPYVAERIAQIKGVTTEEVISVTEENAMKLLKVNCRAIHA